MNDFTGVRDRVGEAVQPEEIYDMFLEKLKNCLSKEVLDKSISDSFTVKKSVMKRGKTELSGFFNGQNNLHNSMKAKKQCTEKLVNVDSKTNSNDNFSFQFSF